MTNPTLAQAPAGLTIACPACDAPTTLAPDQEAQTARCGACGGALFTGRPMTLTAARFDAHTAPGGLPLVIDFWAAWCGPCKSMAPVFEALAAEFEPHVRFAKVDTDAERALADYFRISSIPTLSFIHDHREVARVAGAMFAGDMRRWLYDALSRAQEAHAKDGAAPEPAGEDRETP
ncbi:thioredoxin fold domain-containing protein [Xanthobacter autotrophicus]|uniref:thioredoxin domain-containing protein n=1 Tax=Xanthobacter TaxID=279 RepID=UPI0024AC66C2|nr:thioredoxin domain-containing protein [Xanthobacter autotrophicus]MDI4663003.1 thioredoxin fold domain-containing protein [Xanthobacter autotrophicus]